MLSRRFAVPGYRVDHERVSLDELRERVGSDVTAVPGNAGVLAWDSSAGRWLVHAGARATVGYRLPATLRFLDRHVRPRLGNRTWWSLICLWDGWREDSPRREGAAPLSRVQDEVLCFAARRGDPEAVLIPEAHYLERFHYARFRWSARLRPARWDRTRPAAIYCGGPHGRSLVPGGPHVRELLRQVVRDEGIDVEVRLGEDVPRHHQLEHRYLLDVDGFVRTYDAWAWKLLSGRLVLSQTSPWETFFTQQFEPWQHFVPIAEDFSDLAERLEWCRSNDDECHAIADRAVQRALRAYAPKEVTARTVEVLRRSVLR